VTHRTRIKICGVCRPEDALLAARLGADAVGMVFHAPASRTICVERAREILALLPPFVTPVGLFVDQSPESVLRTAREIGLRHVQLHGDESPDVIAAVAPLRVIKAIKVERGRFEETLNSWRAAIRNHKLANLAGFVLETAGTAKPGGTGVANDWETVAAAQRAGAFDGLPAIIAAGGLRPETVGNLVATVRPYAVDVSSGVEETLGKKSETKLRAFVEAVRNADGSPARGMAEAPTRWNDGLPQPRSGDRM
jgi:phosphoribosylanthranilate isomerase